MVEKEEEVVVEDGGVEEGGEQRRTCAAVEMDKSVDSIGACSLDAEASAEVSGRRGVWLPGRCAFFCRMVFLCDCCACCFRYVVLQVFCWSCLFLRSELHGSNVLSIVFFWLYRLVFIRMSQNCLKPYTLILIKRYRV